MKFSLVLYELLLIQVEKRILNIIIEIMRQKRRIKFEVLLKVIVYVVWSINMLIFSQFPVRSTTTTVVQAQEEGARPESNQQEEQKNRKLTDRDRESYESVIDKEKGIVLKITRPTNNTLWRFIDGIEYNKEDYLAAEMWRLREKDDDEDKDDYPLLRLHIRVFDSEFLDLLYKKDKFKDWREFWKKNFFDYEISAVPDKSFFVPEKAKIEKNLIEATYKIGGKKCKVTEYQIVGPVQNFPTISYRVRAIIFKDKQYTIIFRILAQVVGKELTQTIEKEFLEILDKITFIHSKNKKK